MSHAARIACNKVLMTKWVCEDGVLFAKSCSCQARILTVLRIRDPDEAAVNYPNLFSRLLTILFKHDTLYSRKPKSRF
ncbi:hypothetical protein GGP41_005290 [Bipolaris sorokiniana]|uniref:Uncharacterized protein n=1 Tax=Cochliobolus sativus TaxID=45130 RepID=A0A8H5ZGE7_COCSA|nr:hypothetical protein GGP41_005290 [Bipolaris sorokiniana]